MRGLLRTLTVTACATTALALSAPQSNAGGSAPDAFDDVTGKVVDVSGDPIQGVRVTARDVGSLGTVMSSDRTNDRGRFRLTGITAEELGLKFNGNPVGFETGWLSCFREAAGVYQVVPTWGAACSHAPGPLQGPVRMDPAP